MANLTACPRPDQLKAIALGELPDSGAESLLEHLERCADCAASLSGIVAKDTLVEAIQANDTISDGKEQQTVSRLIEKVRALLSPDSEIGNVSVESESATLGFSRASALTATEEEEHGLAPPQAVGELGKLGTYRVLKVLGAGGMGKVFLAEDPNLQRLVALKVMKPSLAKNPTARQRFLREARLAASLEHDNIVPIYQVGEDGGTPFLAMQLLKGSSLEDILQGSAPLEVSQAVCFGIQIAEGLAAAHARGMTHRDIKPGNIWVEPIDGGRIKLLDFGLARTSEGGVSLTHEGTVLGTPAYMSPEQARGEPVDGRSDLYSLGCVLYRMTTGALPHEAKDMLGMIAALALHEPTEPRKINARIPPPLADLTMKLLSKDPARRVGTAQEVARSLAAIGDQGDTVSRTPSRSRTHRRGAMAAAAVLFLLVGILFGGQIYRVVTNRGQLVIEIEDPAIEVKIVRDGLSLEDRTSQRVFTLTAGAGEIEVLEKDGLKLVTKRFELTRGGKTTVKVTLQELADARKPNAPLALEPKVPPIFPVEPIRDFTVCHGLTAPEFDTWVSAVPRGMYLRWLDVQMIEGATRFAAVAVRPDKDVGFELRHRIADDDHSAITKDFGESTKRKLRPVWDWRYLVDGKIYRTRLWTREYQLFILQHSSRPGVSREADRVLGEGHTLTSITPAFVSGSPSWILITDCNRRPMTYTLDATRSQVQDFIAEEERRAWSLDQLTAYRTGGKERFIVISSKDSPKPSRVVEWDIPEAKLDERIAVQRRKSIMPWCLTATGSPRELKYTVLWCRFMPEG